MSILSNNRFLQRVNPEIVRARTDAGASLVSDHAVIQPLMRQMVDLGIADSLKLWVHSGLVDTRTSGSDLFVPKVYDISGEENDGTAPATENEPKLVADGMIFNGSANRFDLGTGINSDLHGSSAISFSSWLKINNYAASGNVRFVFSMAVDGNNACYALIINTADISFGARSQFVDSFISISNAISDNEHIHVVTIADYTAKTLEIFLNGISVASGEDISFGSNTLVMLSPNSTRIGNAVSINTGRYWDGYINDVRIFNTALSASQITSIYNATKGYYGIT